MLGISVTNSAVSEISQVLADGRGTVGEFTNASIGLLNNIAIQTNTANKSLTIVHQTTVDKISSAMESLGDTIQAAIADGNITVSELIEIIGNVVNEVLEATGLDDAVIVDME